MRENPKKPEFSDDFKRVLTLIENELSFFNEQPGAAERTVVFISQS
jgi:hypothetical protein